MITEKDLQAAIAECQGVHNPNANTCLKLAAYYTIKEHMFGQQSYSYAPQPTTQVESESEFARLVRGKTLEEIMPVLEELMDAVKVLNPRLYAGVLRKIGT